MFLSVVVVGLPCVRTCKLTTSTTAAVLKVCGHCKGNYLVVMSNNTKVTNNGQRQHKGNETWAVSNNSRSFFLRLLTGSTLLILVQSFHNKPKANKIYSTRGCKQATQTKFSNERHFTPCHDGSLREGFNVGSLVIAPAFSFVSPFFVSTPPPRWRYAGGF